MCSYYVTFHSLSILDDSSTLISSPHIFSNNYELRSSSLRFLFIFFCSTTRITNSLSCSIFLHLFHNIRTYSSLSWSLVFSHVIHVIPKLSYFQRLSSLSSDGPRLALSPNWRSKYSIYCSRTLVCAHHRTAERLRASICGIGSIVSDSETGLTDGDIQ